MGESLLGQLETVNPKTWTVLLVLAEIKCD